MENPKKETVANMIESSLCSVNLSKAAPYKLIEAKHGIFLVNPMDVYVGRALFKYGECSEKECETLSKLLLPGKDVVEIGANIGCHSIPLAKLVDQLGGRLLAVEPQPFIFQNLCANFALNGLNNVRAENVACGDVSAWVSFSPPSYHTENNFGGISMREDDSGNIKVRCMPLDELIPGDFDVGLLKIDVEGFELKVLMGASETITRCRPFIYVENDRLEKSKPLIEYLWSIDYLLWWDAPVLFNENNYFGVKENIYANVASFNMLCLPREWNVTLPTGTQVQDSLEHPLTWK